MDDEQHPLIAKAIQICKSQRGLADKLGCGQQTISKMLNREIPVSAEHALLISNAVDGEILPQELRPDLPWPAPQQMEAAQCT